jgi:hypothetical protein
MIAITAVRRRSGSGHCEAALLATAALIPYDVQRIAHELWDYAELKGFCGCLALLLLASACSQQTPADTRAADESAIRV